MAKKIFVSYKHSDSGVASLDPFAITTARDYVDLLEKIFEGDHIYKGEKNDESLAGFKDETIESHLRDKIFDSSVTIVLISKNMKETGTEEGEQWIPWEVSYSLKAIPRNGRVSATNAMLAVILPDENRSYGYFVEPIGCSHCNGVLWKNEELFEIIGGNMFNRKEPNVRTCAPGGCGVLHTGNDHSYIHPVRWIDFVADVNWFIDHAVRINQNIEEYEVKKMTA